nr:MAG TPA: hypothetical protein [Caudoviricetes sp.]
MKFLVFIVYHLLERLSRGKFIKMIFMNKSIYCVSLLE